MAMSTLESGPKLDWTRDNQMYERYRIWRKKVEFQHGVLWGPYMVRTNASWVMVTSDPPSPTE